MKIDFLVVGAEKSGTTWLAEMLKLHPQVYIPEQKELHYFNRKFDEAPDLKNYNFDKPIAWYYSYFEKTEHYLVKGEACPAYLWDEYAPKKIYQYFPGAKIIILLRDPVERAYSAYRFWKQRGVIPARYNFSRAVESYPHHLIKRSKYFEQVKLYLNTFGPDQVLVMLMDDLKNDSIKFLKTVEAFIDVDFYIPESVDKRYHVTADVKHTWLNKIISNIRLFIRKHEWFFFNDIIRKLGLANLSNKIRRINIGSASPTDVEKMSPADKNLMYEYIKDDVEELETLLARDISHWKRITTDQ